MGVEEVDLMGDPPVAPSRKRRAREMFKGQSSTFASSSRAGNKASKVIDLTADDEDADMVGEEMVKPEKKRKAKRNDVDGEAEDKPKQKKQVKKKGGDGDEGEKRLRKYRAEMPQAVKGLMERATSQRMFVIDRARGGTTDCPNETLTIAGTTGNVYTIVIDQVPACDCPYAHKGHQCKHVLFALSRVLRAPANLSYQLALLPSELRLIFSKAPPIAPVDADTTDSNRKPISADDNCPICFMEFENGYEDTVHCKAACGNNVHSDCFEQWSNSRKRSGAPVTCPFCRSNWTQDEGVVKQVVKRGVKTSEGYVNVANQVGISTQRDYSTYHSFWVRRQLRAGDDVGDWEDPDD